MLLSSLCAALTALCACRAGDASTGAAAAASSYRGESAVESTCSEDGAGGLEPSKAGFGLRRPFRYVARQESLEELKNDLKRRQLDIHEQYRPTGTPLALALSGLREGEGGFRADVAAHEDGDLQFSVEMRAKVEDNEGKKAYGLEQITLLNLASKKTITLGCSP